MTILDTANMKNKGPGDAPNADLRALVFLDIDDVLCVHRTLNTKDVLAVLDNDGTVDASTVWQQIFHRHAVENLRQLDDEFRPWYVVSSSWTLHLTREQLCAAFEATGLGFVADNLQEHWCTPRDDDSYRLVEIDAWLDLHAWRGTRLLAAAPYVIIDDVLSGQSLVGSHLEEHAVFCDASGGFLYPQLEAARKILGASLGRDDGI
ncbi:HAD domain-containing protein [Burkholderia sp. LMU1-1-1.1]|uniref:HAD domain-containing protein n=1 Tax=Burkholderia sp. LMU1-1-1.1 TaxID=3135266 RepID=UPI0034449D19